MKADNGLCRSPDNYSFMTVHWHASGKKKSGRGEQQPWGHDTQWESFQNVSRCVVLRSDSGG